MNNKWFLYKEHLQKDLENPMIFLKSKRDSKNYIIKPKSHKNKDLSFFAQGVLNFSSPKWDPYIGNIPKATCTSPLKNGPKINEETIKALVAQS